MTVIQPSARSTQELAEILRSFEVTEIELNRRLDSVLARGPEWFREEARLRGLLNETRERMADLRLSFDERGVAEGLSEIYATGATDIEGALGQRFAWSSAHLGAVDKLAADTFDDLLTATKYVEASAKQVIRQAAKLATQFKVGGGQTAVQGGRELASKLRESGIGVVTYRNGARHGVGEYSQMVLRTKSAVAYNIGTLNHSAAAGIKAFEIVDGADCGLSWHDDPTLANGLVVDGETAAAFAIAHPNCRRVFVPRLDVAPAKPAFDPSTTAAQREDQKLFEKFLRDQQRAKGRKRVPRKKAKEAAPPKPKRVPRTKRKEPKPKAVRPVEAPRPQVGPADIGNAADKAALDRAHESLKNSMIKEGERFDVETVNGPGWTWDARGLAKQAHAERVADEIRAGLDEAVEAKLRAAVPRKDVDGRALSNFRQQIFNRRDRSVIKESKNAFDYNDTRLANHGFLTPDGEAKLRGITKQEWIDGEEKRLAAQIDNLYKRAAKFAEQGKFDEERALLDLVGERRNAETFIRQRRFGEVRGRQLSELTDDELRLIGSTDDVTGLVELDVQRFTDKWAGTSGDTDTQAVAMQVVAGDEFGFSTDAMWRGLDPLHGADAQPFRDRVAQIVAADGDMMRRYLRTVYKQTQEYLANEGISEVVVQRGMRFKQATAPEAVKNLTSTASVRQAVGNPLQSWSTSGDIAQSFAGRGGSDISVLFTARVPASRVLSLPWTGPGCLEEWEWVMLGIDDVPVAAALL